MRIVIQWFTALMTLGIVVSVCIPEAVARTENAILTIRTEDFAPSPILDNGTYRIKAIQDKATKTAPSIPLRLQSKPAASFQVQTEVGLVTYRYAANTTQIVTTGPNGEKAAVIPIKDTDQFPQSHDVLLDKPGLLNRPLTVSLIAIYSGESEIAKKTTAEVATLQSMVNSELAKETKDAKKIADLQAEITRKQALIQKLAVSDKVQTLHVMQVYADNEPPQIVGDPIIESFPSNAIRVTLQMKDSDLDPVSVNPSNFNVNYVPVGQKAGTASLTLVVDSVTYLPSARHIIAEFQGRGQGNYVIKAGGLQDQSGNTMAALTSSDNADNSRTFPIQPGPQQGRQVDYPDFLAKNGVEDQDFNPEHRIDTRVIRLYYYRNAHRLAEIINRNVQQLNQAGVDEAGRLAENARRNTEEATDKRRRQEFDAIQAATETRRVQKEIAAEEEKLAAAQAEQSKLNQNIDSTKKEKNHNDITLSNLDSAIANTNADTTLDKDKKNEKLASLNAEKSKSLELQKNNTDAGTAEASTQQILNDAVNATKQRIADLKNDLVKKQKAEATENTKTVEFDAIESRRAGDQWRAEVRRGLTDPNTYVAGNLFSKDPIAQCSISVIGEGLIQVRGPVKGINKIARIIHQIDTPVGQVKVGIHTVQVNGEHGDRMEFVYERIDKHIAHARFLSAQSTEMFRKAVQNVASQVASHIDRGNLPLDCPPEYMLDQQHVGMMPGFEKPDGGKGAQQIRNMRYLYGFFGKDFLDELKRMESELLNVENKLLSLHSMDSISLSGAFYLASLARNDIRTQIMAEFKRLVDDELPRAEMDYWRALTTIRSPDKLVNAILVSHFQNHLDAKDARKIMERAIRVYTFPNLMKFFDGAIVGTDTMNAAQFATIRMAQALKAQLLAEIELKNLVQNRSLLERQKDEYQETARVAKAVRSGLEQQRIKLAERENTVKLNAEQVASKIGNIFFENINIYNDKQGGNIDKKNDMYNMVVTTFANTEDAVGSWSKYDYDKIISKYSDIMNVSYHKNYDIMIENAIRYFAGDVVKSMSYSEERKAALCKSIVEFSMKSLGSKEAIKYLKTEGGIAEGDMLLEECVQYMITLSAKEMMESKVLALMAPVIADLVATQQQVNGEKVKLNAAIAKENDAFQKVFDKRLLDSLIAEQDEKAVELLEAMRSHVANVDNYLKRLAIALEDDIYAQFHRPAFQAIRRASYYWDVQLGQVETTTILTNNRAFAKVQPAATMEFDMPQRDILAVEAFKDARALTVDMGNLVNDPAFLSVAKMLNGTPAPGMPNSGLPFQGIPQPQDRQQRFGAELEKLIPDPAVYKFETGTGFEIRPVIQPDGHSIIYNFDYMYTTNVREPVRADEKHLGRVKRHFIHTDVQTSSYEIRELSRYTVALKASRTSKGVPLLEDLPYAGVLFRPLPSDESSLQQNIILASSTVYPTTYDLMGLRWSPYADQLSSPELASQKKVLTSRRDELSRYIKDKTRTQADNAVGYSGNMESEMMISPYQNNNSNGTVYQGIPTSRNYNHVPQKASQAGIEGNYIPNSSPNVDERLNKPLIQLSPATQQPPAFQQLPQIQNRSPINPPPPAPTPTPTLPAPGGFSSRNLPASNNNVQLISSLMQRGNEEIKQGLYQQSIQTFSQVILADQSSAEGYYCRAVAQHYAKLLDKAYEDYSQAIALNPKFIQAIRGRAGVSQQMGKIEQAGYDIERLRFYEAR